MVRIAHTGDLHLTEGPRFQSTLTCLRHVVEDGRANDVKLWLIGGDLAGHTVPHRMTIAERNALAEVFQAMAQTAAVVIAYGNHDYPLDLEIFEKLKAPYAIRVVSRPEAFTIAGVRLYVLPYPTKRFFVGANGPGSIEQQRQQVEGLLDTILTSWRADRLEYPQLPAVLLGHINIGGSRTAGGEVLIGQEIELAPHDLDTLGVEYGALSHIHLHQQMSQVGWYAGSPDRGNFGETDEKGYLIVDIESGQAPVIQRRLTPAVRLVTVTAKWDDRLVARYDDEIRGAEIRLRVEIPEEHAAAAGDQIEKLSAELTAQGAIEVKVERRIIPKTRVRSEAMQHAVTTPDKLAAYWESLGDTGPDSKMRERVLARLVELETPVEVENREAA